MSTEYAMMLKTIEAQLGLHVSRERVNNRVRLLFPVMEALVDTSSFFDLRDLALFQHEMKAAQENIFSSVLKHIRTYDPSIQNRLEAIEAAGKEVVQYSRYDGSNSTTLRNATYTLEGLLHTKSGAVSWNPVYNQKPEVKQVATIKELRLEDQVAKLTAEVTALKAKLAYVGLT